MSELSNNYRQRLTRMNGEAKPSAVTVATTRRSVGARSSSTNADYKQMRSDITGTAAVSTRSDAAALQNDLAQRYNLQCAVRPSQKVGKHPTHFLICTNYFFLLEILAVVASLHIIQKKKAPPRENLHSSSSGTNRSTTNSSSRSSNRSNSSSRSSSSSSSSSSGEAKLVSSSRLPPRHCDSCQALNPPDTSVCNSCGFFLAGSYQVPSTMAQSRGLITAPIPAREALKAYEWDSIEKGVASRQDAYCPICMEGFNRGYEVLLSCSHMYHRTCLQSFEKFMKSAERSCPICRTTNYQKKITVRHLKQNMYICCVRQLQFDFDFLSFFLSFFILACRNNCIRAGLRHCYSEKLARLLVSLPVLQ
jgi:hypothetical protein